MTEETTKTSDEKKAKIEDPEAFAVFSVSTVATAELGDDASYKEEQIFEFLGYAPNKRAANALAEGKTATATDGTKVKIAKVVEVLEVERVYRLKPISKEASE